MHIGTPPDYQQLILKEHGHVICEMRDNTKMLGFYSVKSGMEIHIIDNDPYSLSRGGGLTDVSLVEKYKMSDEAYDKRKNTMRDFIRNKRKEDPNFKLKPTAGPGSSSGKASSGASEDVAPPGIESVEGVTEGARCEVMPGARRGTVRFVGEIPEIAAGGHWVGVEFDEPLGHNDGSVKGRVIFPCAPGYGAFVRGKNITVGDFPVRDPFDDEDDELDEDKHATIIKTTQRTTEGDCGDSCACDGQKAQIAEEDEDEI